MFEKKMQSFEQFWVFEQTTETGALSTRVALAVIVCALSIAGTIRAALRWPDRGSSRLVLTPSGKCVLRAADFSCSPQRGPPVAEHTV